MKLDVYAQLADYRGVLRWNAFTDGLGNARPQIDVPLYVKSHAIPVRKPKVTELSTGPMITTSNSSSIDAGLNILFEGAPDILEVDISGFIVTPTSNNLWAPIDTSGNPLSLGNVSYADIVSMFLSGEMNPNPSNYLERKDPNYYFSPYGQQYINPIIVSWAPTYQPQQKRQQFDMTLVLEN